MLNSLYYQEYFKYICDLFVDFGILPIFFLHVVKRHEMILLW